ncbi:MAG: hypothetical protein AAGU11_09380 [Syntrophobacteraceae bacterium]
MDKKEILRDYVSDMLGVEKHCLESIERQTADDRFSACPEAHGLLIKIEAVLRSHTGTLDSCLSTLDGEMKGLFTKATTSAMGAIAGLYGKLREDPVSRSLRDDYTALSLAAISYTMLHTTALALHDQPVAALALKHLNDLTPLIVALSRVIPEVVARELYAEDKVADPLIYQAALAGTQRAWSPEVIEKLN